ncbi:MAG: lamin tail domain-containing protein [Theionarchaea archaeon]|nr:lamin tail domain-containing protein [Theionarchaea archaeon]MBU7038290.1 lamin tail domain-containing protein [Theionarchaea archaeon]
MKRVALVALVLMIPVPAMAQQMCWISPAEGSENIVILRVEHTATIPNDEYVVIYNTGRTSVDLSGWVVFDSYYETYRHLPPTARTDPLITMHIYRIPYGVVLKSHCWVRICSGYGKNNGLYLYRDLRTQWLKDEGDTLYLMDNYCNLISQFTW